MNKRVGFCGASGTGKSTIAKWLAEHLGIPFIEGSTKPLWESRGITSHNDILVRSATDNAWGLQFEWDVLNYRKSEFENKDEFVSDRSPIDMIAYYLYQVSYCTTKKQTEEFISAALGVLSNFTHIFICPLAVVPEVEDDGKRITNPWFQYVIDTLISSLFMRQDIQVFKLAKIETHIQVIPLINWDMETRKQDILMALSGLKVVKGNGLLQQ